MSSRRSNRSVGRINYSDEQVNLDFVLDDHETAFAKANSQSFEEMSEDESPLPMDRYPVGQVIEKEFQAGWFEGKVVGYSEDDYFYRILYEDGDKEDFSHGQMKEAVRVTKKRQRRAQESVNVSARKPSTATRTGSSTKKARTRASLGSQQLNLKVGGGNEEEEQVTKPSATSVANRRSSPRTSAVAAAHYCEDDEEDDNDDEAMSFDSDDDDESLSFEADELKKKRRRASASAAARSSTRKAKTRASLGPQEPNMEDGSDGGGKEEEAQVTKPSATRRSSLRRRSTSAVAALHYCEDDEEDDDGDEAMSLDGGGLSDDESLSFDSDEPKKKPRRASASLKKAPEPQRLVQPPRLASYEVTSAAAAPAQLTKKVAARRPSKKKAAPKSEKTEPDFLYDGSKKILRAPYTVGDHLPILTAPQDMFDDMVERIWTDENGDNLFLPLFKRLKNRPLRVATVCSGTESPLLALDMLQQAISRCAATKGGNIADCSLPVEHVFSCEIEPFKQAYIERNFGPPLLFRDVRELGNEEAHTAFGAVVAVPVDDMDLMVAGTSCVDYSNLNNQKKELEQGGESGQTFMGMMRWIEKAKPAMVILENVCGAPWDKKMKLFDERGYNAVWQRIDTKKYYIPHTRQRGYLFAVRKQDGGKAPAEDGGKAPTEDVRTKLWTKLVKELERPASAALDAFMLSNADPRVLRGRARLTAESSTDGEARTGRVDWTKCENLHQYHRSKELLGDKRPLTQWSESGQTAMPSFCWNDWTNAQVHRIQDLIDINTLRLAQVGIDCTYKTMVWNLSQNVDRDTMGKLGLCQCLTPSGVPYVTNRGGPLVGEELLLLQGIPADDLLLTKETEDNLKDLAGNAMTSTVVGAAILSALLAGHAALAPREVEDNKAAPATSLVPRPLVRPSCVTISKDLGDGDYEETQINLGPRNLSGETEWKSLLSEADRSSRKCSSESEEAFLPFESLVECRECGQTSSHATAFPARKFEEHDFVSMKTSKSRGSPHEFRKKLSKFVPMRLGINNLHLSQSMCPSGADKPLFRQWLRAVQDVVFAESEEPLPVEFRLTRIARSSFWTVFYESQSQARLELRITRSGATWLLFAKAPSTRGRLRDVLLRPYARMRVVAPENPNQSFSLLSGNMEVCLPFDEQIDLRIEGAGEELPSWRSRLGLKGDFEDEQVNEKLGLFIESKDHDELKAQVDGFYHLLPKCGGACGSLRKKTSTSTCNSPDIFLFLESGRKSQPKDDCVVLATTCHRTTYGEYREVCLEIKQDLAQLKSSGYSGKICARVPGKWIGCSGASIEAWVGNTATMRMCTPTQNTSLRVPIHTSAWTECPEMVSCTIPMSPDESFVSRCVEVGSVAEINLHKSNAVFEALAFVTSRLEIPGIFNQGSWLRLDRRRLRSVEGEDPICSVCAPARPHVQWTALTKANRTTFLPVEDGKEAAVYERLLKERPEPWIARLEVSKGEHSLTLRIGCNVASLAQRALGLFPQKSLVRRLLIDLASREPSCSSESSFDWRVVAHEERMWPNFEKLRFRSNKSDPLADQPPSFQEHELRMEQRRSLHWMLQQEASAKPFFEEEVAESILPQMKWRVEARSRRPVLVRGGIIADEVGYGKTVISLGLIDAAEKVNGSPPEPPSEYSAGTIFTKATLVIVPAHLMGQWPEEIKKFLGSNRRVVVLKSMLCFNKLTLEDIQNAEVVVTNFTVLSNEKYFTRLARLSGVHPGSLPTGPKGGRYFQAVYKECCDALPKRVSEIVHRCADAFSSLESDARTTTEKRLEGALRLDGRKRARDEDGRGHEATQSIGSTDRDPWELSKSTVKKTYTKMKSPPLEMFFWNRVIVDEFTYLAETKRDRVLELVLNLKTNFRWCLSGTPRHASFDDIQSLAKLLGVHLGVPEALPGTKIGKAKHGKEITGLENLSQFLEVRSMQWHERRHKLAQAFLNRFVRQNIAEIDEIRFEDKATKLTLPPAERAIYMELETHLKSLEMNAKTAQKSKKNSIGDRDYRMQKVLEGSATGEEALLKCCSHFNMSSDAATALQTLNDVIELRRKQKEELIDETIAHLIAAFRLRLHILDEQPDWLSVTKTGSGEIIDALEQHLVAVKEGKSISQGADNDIHEEVARIVEEARTKFMADQRGSNGTVSKLLSECPTLDGSEDDTETLLKMKLVLRNHMHRIKSLGKELCGRIRSLRYIQQLQYFHGNGPASKCSKCGAGGVYMGVLSSCGHGGCVVCLEKFANEGNCILVGSESKSCEARVTAAQIVRADCLGTNVDGTHEGKFGKKLQVLAERVLKIIKHDRVIVFCQFDDLTKKVCTALRARKVKVLQVEGTVSAQTKVLSILQREKPENDDPRVLLLKMDDEQSAGLNLTNFNHAIFVHPLLAGNQQEYDAYETQAIGRIRRYGQRKTVHVWRLLAEDTIDTEIFRKHSKSSDAQQPL